MPFTIWNNSTHQAGTFISPGVIVPNDARELQIYLTGLNLPTEPITLVIQWMIERSADNGATWQHMAGSTIQGGMTQRYPVISLTTTVEGIRGQLIRGTIVLSQRSRFGIEAEWIVEVV